MQQEQIDKLLKRRLYVQRYVTQVFNDVIEQLAPRDRELIRIIRDFIDDADEGTLQALAQRRNRNEAAAAVVREIKAVLRAQRDEAKQIVREANEQLLAREVIVTQAVVNPEQEPPSAVGLAALAVGGVSLSERFQHAFSLITRRVISTIATAADSSPQSIVPLIRGSKAQRFRDGVFFWRDNRLLRPEIDVVINGGSGEAANRVYRANKIEYVSWLSTLDQRVCISCLNAEAGSPYPINQAPRYPLHPKDRCLIIPEDNPERQKIARPFVRDNRPVSKIPKSERANKIGETRETITQYFERWTESEKRDWLGKSRYKLLKEGKVKSLSDLIEERTFRPLRLDELPET